MRCGMVFVLADFVHREMDPLRDAAYPTALGNERSSGPLLRERASGCEIERKKVGGFTEQGDAAIVAMNLESWRSELVEERKIEAVHGCHAHSRCAGIVG